MQLGIGAVIVVVVVGLILSRGKTVPEQVVPSVPQPPLVQENPATNPPTESVSAVNYKDGTYEATGAYRSPAGAETVPVKLTLKDGVITSVTVTPTATNPKSVRFQGLFIGGVNAAVVGKNINEVNLDKVSGSSLTPKGFNDALAQIKAQAKT